MMEAQQQGVSLGVAFDMVPGLDGNTWARMTLTHGLASLVLALPPDAMAKLIAGMTSEFDAVRAAIIEHEAPLQRASLADLQRLDRKHGRPRR